MRKLLFISRRRPATLVLTCLLLLSLAYCASANDTITLDAGWLYGLAGTQKLPANSLLLLVASASGTTFGGPTAGSFTSAGDQILGITAQGSNSNNGTGGLLGNGTETVNNFVTSSAMLASVTMGNDVALYWFPTITATQYNSGTKPALGTVYGAYQPEAINLTPATSQNPDGNDLWTVPADNGGNPTLNFFTTMDSGTQPEADGFARFTVLPEPSTYALLGLAGLAMVAGGVLRKRGVA
jgi:hypothetical protein